MLTKMHSPIDNPPLNSPEHYRRLAHAGNTRQRTNLGTCPHCGGNVIRVTLPPLAQPHAHCLQCARDMCCPPIDPPSR